MTERVRTPLDEPAALTEAQAEALSFGQAHWWVRQRDGDFVKLPKRIRGDQPLSLTVDLEPGSYTLGVGPVREGVRVDFDVEAVVRGEAQANPTADLTGKRFVFTGDLDCMGRDALKPFLTGLGAKVTGSVSGKTDYLVVGHEPGAKKLEKAKQVGTTVLDEAGFVALVGIEQAAETEPSVTTPQGMAKRYLQRMTIDPAVMNKAQAVSRPKNFDDMGASGREIWGIAIGPRGGRYEVFIDMGNRNPRWALSCNCSSRSRPCRHALALLLAAADRWLPPAPAPDGHQERSQDRFSFME